MFKKQFGKGISNHVMPGDTITCTVGDFTATARIHRDDCTDRPDQRQDGFWPSLDPNNAGYIGPKTARTLARHRAKTHAIMQAWADDEWFYCGVTVTVEACGVQITGNYSNALWGVECNFPGSKNTYLRDVANELLPQALEEARAKVECLRAA